MHSPPAYRLLTAFKWQSNYAKSFTSWFNEKIVSKNENLTEGRSRLHIPGPCSQIAFLLVSRSALRPYLWDQRPHRGRSGKSCAQGPQSQACDACGEIHANFHAMLSWQWWALLSYCKNEIMSHIDLCVRMKLWSLIRRSIGNGHRKSCLGQFRNMSWIWARIQDLVTGQCNRLGSKSTYPPISCWNLLFTCRSIKQCCDKRDWDPARENFGVRCKWSIFQGWLSSSGLEQKAGR